MLQPGRPKRATAIVELIAGGLAATTAIHKGEPDSTTQDAPTEMTAEAETATEGRLVDAFGVKVVRVDRENAPAPDARAAMGLPESKVGRVNDRFITDR
jgi:hypothetical protein